MPPASIRDQVSALPESFVADTTPLIRAAALGGVEEALGGMGEVAPVRARRSRPRRKPVRSQVEMIETPPPARRPAPPSIPWNRHAVDVDKLGDAIVEHLAEHPELRLEELARALEAEPTDVKRARVALKAANHEVIGSSQKLTMDLGLSQLSPENVL